MHYNQLHKLVIIGDTGVGKSSIVSRYLLNINKSSYNDCGSYHYDSIEPTIGASFFTVIFDNIKLQIWDTAGQERFKSICPIYYRGSSGCICVFDVTNRNSFIHIDEWISLYKSNVSNNLYLTESQCQSNILLVANKTDSSHWNVSIDEISQKSSKLHCNYVLTSAISMVNFTQFSQLVKSSYTSHRPIVNTSLSLESSATMPYSHCKCY